jgi:hypothetical protein
MADLRELILHRLQDCVATTAPATTFFFPGGMPHAPIVNNLGGRVYNKMRANVRTDAAENPYVEIITDPAGADTIEASPSDDDLYFATLRVKLWCYQRATDQGDGLNSDLRAALNSLRADLIIAASAFPYWSGPTPAQADALYVGIAPGTTVKLISQWTDVATDSPYGTLVLEFAIRYPFNKRTP